MTKEQERARARRRQEKLDAREAVRAREAARTRQAVAAVVAVLAVVALFVFLAQRLNGDDATDTASTPKASASVPMLEGCVAAPARPSEAKSMTLPDKATAAGKTFVATVTTNCGDITMELDGAKAPQTVASFKSLAEGAYWDGSPCHRLTTAGIFVLQCGDPTGTGSGNPGYGYGIENAPADGTYPPGTLAMARAQDPNSNGGQFFIVYKETKLPTEGGGYSIFGKVTGGMDIVERIAAAGVSEGAQDGPPAAPISILKVAVTEKKA